MNDNLRYDSDLKIEALYESNAHELRKPRELGGAFSFKIPLDMMRLQQMKPRLRTCK